MTAGRVLRGVAYALAGYAIGAVGGVMVVSAMSSNTHDRSLEAAMTGAFVIGPAVAVATFIAILLKSPGKG